MLLRLEWRPLLEVRRRQRFSRRSSLTEGNPAELDGARQQHPTARKTWLFLARWDVLTVTLETQQSLFYSDEFSWVSFADEHFEQPQFGFDVLVFVVLHSQWGAVLLLHIPAGTRRQTLRSCEKKTFVSRFLIMQFQIFDIDKLFFSYLPFCLKNWSSNSFKFLRILFFSSLVSWSCSTSSCLWGEEKCFLNVSH